MENGEKTINIMNNIIDDYIVVNKPEDNNIKKLFSNIKNIFNTV